MTYEITKERLYIDLLIAFHTARQHKGDRDYVRQFESYLSGNLRKLCDELYERRYKPEPYSCFIVQYPKKREVFSASFRDRIVHHLIYNYTHTLFERTFIYDTYSCIAGKGTHFGIDRLRTHILRCSRNYTRPCYALKMDIKGYFMHIDRELLYRIASDTLVKMGGRKSNMPGKRWNEVIDIDFNLFLMREVIMADPTEDCGIRGGVGDWAGLPKSKSLFNMQPGYGLPIGNLTSQLYSNVFLNELDQFVKRTLRCQYYGRYVDDFYLLDTDKDRLMSHIPHIGHFLKDSLHLEVNQSKTHIIHVRQGVEFLGAYVKPHRTYISNQSLRRMRPRISMLGGYDSEKLYHSANSYLGVLSHYHSFHIRKELLSMMPPSRTLFFNDDLTKAIRIPW